jgi:hypothetical protein
MCLGCIDRYIDEEELSGCVGRRDFRSVGADVEVVGGFFGERWDCWAAEWEDDEVVDGCGDRELLYGCHFGGVEGVLTGGIGNVAKRIYLFCTLRFGSEA